MSIFLVFYSFFITIGVPAYQPHGHWTQYYVRTDSYYFRSFTQPLNVRKTSPNWEKNTKDGLQNFHHTVTPRNTGRQGTNKFHLLLEDFRYCQYRKLKEMT